MKKYFDINGIEVKVGDTIKTLYHDETYIVRKTIINDGKELYPQFVLQFLDFEIIKNDNQ